MRVATVLLALLLPASASAVEVGWSSGTSVTGTPESGAVGVATGDLDRDGTLDLVWANNTGDTLRVGLGSGTGTFTATTVAAADGPTDVVLADVDGDGDADIVYAGSEDGEFAWLANDGSAGTWTKTLIGVDTGAVALAMADMDSDGDLDLVGGSWDGGNVEWFENLDGAGSSWSAAQVIDATLGQIAEVAVADVNGDGVLDVVASAYTPGAVGLYIGDGAGGFTASVIDAASPGASGLALADLDRDGNLDIVHAQTNGGMLVWYANDGSWTKNTIAPSAPGARGVHLADLDHDGDVDVLLSLNGGTGGANQVRWYENMDGVGGTWGAQTIDSSFANTNRSLAADFDGDGDLDIVATGTDANEVRYYANPIIHGSTHDWQQVTTTAGSADPRHTTVIDIDGDGFLDFVGGGNQGLIVGINDGTGSFTQTLVDGSQQYWATAAGDLDGDGDIDVFGAGRSGTTKWFANLGGFFLGPGVVIATGTGDGRDADIADIDGDGDLDIAWAESEQNDLVLYFNDGGATSFSELDVDETLIGAFSVEIVDFDDDGDMDLLAVGQQDDDVVWYENDGTSTTQGSWTPQLIAAPVDPRSAAQGDIDGDGDRDVVAITTATNTPTIELYTNAGDDVTWSTTVIDSGLANGWHIELADLDRDGDLDILASTGDDVRMYANDGSGGFGTAQVAGTGTNILHGGLGDFDLDGDLDGLFPHLSGTDRWTLYLNEWAQTELVGTDLAPATKVFGSQQVLLQQWEMGHLGRTGDIGISFADMAVTFTDGAGTPLTTSEIRSVVASLSIYRDDGDLVFNAASDLLKESNSFLSSSSGIVSTSFTFETQATVATGALFWLVLETEPDAPYAGIPTVAVDGPTDAFIYDNGVFLQSDTHLGAVTSILTIAQAPVADAGGPYSGDEGVAVAVDGSASSDTDGSIVGWTWDCDNDGTYETSGATASCTFGDDGTFTVGLEVVDDDGLDQTTSTTVTVANVAPTVSASGAATANEGTSETYTVTASDVTDDPLSLQWFVSPPSGGTTTGGTATTETVTFTDDGTWTLTVTADDGDGGSTSDTVTVTVANLAPSITTTATTAAVEGTAWTYLPAATDPGGDVLSWSVNGSAPAAMLVDAGTGALFWTPTLADAGTVTFILTVDDGDGGTDTETITITVAFLDGDMDGLPDTWETANGLDLNTDDAAADPDADGVSNLDEYLAGTDPNSYDGPSVPVQDAPIGAVEVADATPQLSWFAASDPQGDALTYEVELYEVPSLAILLETVSGLSSTDWTPTVAVAENAAGYWRVRASDGNVDSGWSNLEAFVVNETEEPPSVPAPASPLTGDSVSVLAPELTWSASTDPDADPVTYDVRIQDAAGTTVVVEETAVGGLAWTSTADLTDNTPYSWDVRAVDDEGLSSAWSTPQEFFVDLTNDPPSDIAWVAPLDGDALVTSTPLLEVTASTDIEGDALTYVFELDLVPSYDSPELLSFGSGTNTWDLAADNLPLTENVSWFARARVEDARGAVTLWAEIEFFVRGANDGPAAPALVAPEDGSAFPDASVPTLVAGHVQDPEGDPVTYGFRVARDEALADIVAEVTELEASAGAEGTADQTSWTPDLLAAGTYYWTASAADDGGASTDADEVWSFSVEEPPGDDDDATGDDDDDDGTGCDCGSSVAGPDVSPAAFGWLLLPLLLRRRR